jgi:hypothetical protein
LPINCKNVNAKPKPRLVHLTDERLSGRVERDAGAFSLRLVNFERGVRKPLNDGDFSVYETGGTVVRLLRRTKEYCRPATNQGNKLLDSAVNLIHVGLPAALLSPGVCLIER